jgi:GntR family transcriptional regulator
MKATPTTPAALVRAAGISLHRQLFLVLREQMSRGTYGPGDVLPTEEALCEQFGVSRITVRRALQDLEAGGFVERRHGRGTFVREGPQPDTVAPLTLLEHMRRHALETEAELIDMGVRTVPPAIGRHLHVPSGASVICALRVRRQGDTPLMVTEAWVPERFAAVVTPAALRKRPLYELLLRAGVKFGRVVQELSAEAADPRRAGLLGTSIGAPLIRVTRLVHDDRGDPIEYLTAHLTPERSRVLMELGAEDIDTLRTGYVVHDVLPTLRDVQATARDRGTPRRRTRGTSARQRAR